MRRTRSETSASSSSRRSPSPALSGGSVGVLSFCLSASIRASRAPALGAALASAGAPERRGAVAVAVARRSVAWRGSVSASVGRSSSSRGSIQPGAVRIPSCAGVRRQQAPCWHNLSRGNKYGTNMFRAAGGVRSDQPLMLGKWRRGCCGPCGCCCRGRTWSAGGRRSSAAPGPQPQPQPSPDPDPIPSTDPNPNPSPNPNPLTLSRSSRSCSPSVTSCSVRAALGLRRTNLD